MEYLGIEQEARSAKEYDAPDRAHPGAAGICIPGAGVAKVYACGKGMGIRAGADAKCALAGHCPNAFERIGKTGPIDGAFGDFGARSGSLRAESRLPGVDPV